MIKVSVYYPYSDGASFDMDYYLSSHMPMVFDRCSPKIKSMHVDGGLAGGPPGSTPPFAAIGHLVFDSVEDFQSSFGPHTDEIMGDIPNYTKIEPVIQISEIKL